jgi:hypothetical protein
MRRLFWLAMGITIGALVVRKLSRAAERLTPRGLAETVTGGLAELSASIRDFSGEVRAAMSEREAELRVGTGLDGQLGKSSAPEPSAAPDSTVGNT